MTTEFVKQKWQGFVSDVLNRHFSWSDFCCLVLKDMLIEAIKRGETDTSNLKNGDGLDDNFYRFFMESVHNVTKEDYVDLVIHDIDGQIEGGGDFHFDTDDYIYDYFGYGMNQHLMDKTIEANKGYDLDKLHQLTMRLWEEKKIILLNNASCCGTCSWGEVSRTYDEYESKGVKGVIGWWDQNDLMPINNMCIIGIWPDNRNENDDSTTKNINFKNLSMYVIPLLAELDIEYSVLPYGDFKWLELSLGEFILPEFCPKCFE